MIPKFYMRKKMMFHIQLIKNYFPYTLTIIKFQVITKWLKMI